MVKKFLQNSGNSRALILSITERDPLEVIGDKTEKIEKNRILNKHFHFVISTRLPFGKIFLKTKPTSGNVTNTIKG